MRYSAKKSSAIWMKCRIRIQKGGYIATANFSLRNFLRFPIKKQLRRIIFQRPKRVRKKKDTIGATSSPEYSKQLSKRQIFPIVFAMFPILFSKTLLSVAYAARRTGLFRKNFNFYEHKTFPFPVRALSADTLSAIPFEISRGTTIGRVCAGANRQKMRATQIRSLISMSRDVVQMNSLLHFLQRILHSCTVTNVITPKWNNKAYGKGGPD